MKPKKVVITKLITRPSTNNQQAIDPVNSIRLVTCGQGPYMKRGIASYLMQTVDSKSQKPK